MTTHAIKLGVNKQAILDYALCLLAASVLFSQTLISGALADERYGTFSGQPVVEFLPGGRNVKLREEITFTDSNNREWHVPSGVKTNGASIPRFLWVNYPPFTGKYRIAAVIHDHYCVTKDRKWQQVHRMFYDAMRAAGVKIATAKAMYAAVYLFGPRWAGRSQSIVLPNPLPDQEKIKIFKELEQWIKQKNPTPKEIRMRMRSRGLD